MIVERALNFESLRPLDSFILCQEPGGTFFPNELFSFHLLEGLVILTKKKTKKPKKKKKKPN
jgi:hypothetical protein